MVERAGPQLARVELPAARTYWISRLAVSLVYPVVAVRKLSEISVDKISHLVLPILVVGLLLYIIEPYLVRTGRVIRLAYYLVQGGLILALGWLRPYEDTWAALYLPLSMSIWYENSRQSAALWSLFYAGCMTVTMFLHFGWLDGLGYSLTYISASAICISYGSQAVKAEKAQAESHKLLQELQAAHVRLREFAGQAEKLSAAREHERLVRELHDSISQTVFSLTLMVESTRLLLQKEPQRVSGQLDQIQTMTAAALSRMRELISQWQTG